jgi:hypothetical protein
MGAEKTSLADELAPIQTQIGQTQGKIRMLESELRTVAAEIESFSADKRRVDALRGVCTALDALDELGASDLFWEELPGANDVAGHLNRLRDRIARFEDEIRGTQEKHDSLKAKIGKQHHELKFLHEEVRQAYAREERRNEELLIEREVSPIPYRAIIMPWNNQEEDEKRYRRALLVALLFCIVFGTLIPLWKLPVPDRSSAVVVPERLVSLMKKEPPRPEPLPERLKEEKKPEKDQEKTPEKEKQKEDRPKATTAETEAARKKAVSSGVLAFKESFSDLMEETPAAGLGAQARLSNRSAVAAGSARASRSIIAMPSTGGSGGSGGIGNAGVSRNLGSGGGSGSGNRLAGVGFSRVESTVAGLAEEARPLSSGPGPARTDEEIQIVFDKYKATLYRIYNAQLRKNPTLRGKIILRITIEPGGEVSACTVQSNDLASPELVTQIVERVKKFNFGPKEKVSKTTILYPIDFLPGG